MRRDILLGVREKTLAGKVKRQTDAARIAETMRDIMGGGRQP